MDLLISLSILIVLLVGVVIYQSRKDKPDIKVYFSRFSRLVITILSYFKDVGLCAAQKFRQINWDLTVDRYTMSPPLPDDIKKALQPPNAQKLSGQIQNRLNGQSYSMKQSAQQQPQLQTQQRSQQTPVPSMSSASQMAPLSAISAGAGITSMSQTQQTSSMQPNQKG